MDVSIISRFLMVFFISHLYCSNAYVTGYVSGVPTGRIYVGSYSQPDGYGTGIAILEQNQATYKYEYHDQISALSPSALAMDHGRRMLYAVNELHRFDGETGFVSSYNIPWSKAGLTFVNNQSSLGTQPNFLTLDPSQRFLMTANYGTSNVVIYRVQDGRIGDVTQDVTGYGQNAHQIVFDQKHSMVAVPYLGSDLVYFFTMDKERGTLDPYWVFLENNTMVHLSAVVDHGTGPRHLVYSQDGRHFYVIGELASTVTVFRKVIDGWTGQFRAIQVVELLPNGYNGRSWASAIVIHPNGKFLYASERGINHVAIFKINAQNGKLALVMYKPCGKTPRHIVIRTLGKKNHQLFVTNEGDNAIQVFTIDEDGTLDLDYTIEGVNSPTYIQFWP